MDSGYQVSLCDIVDSKLDFVLDVDSASVYWRRHDKPLWWSLCVTLSSLFFFTRVCEHLALLVRGERRPFSQFTTVQRYFGVNKRPFFGNCVITPYGVIYAHVFF